MLPHRNRSRSLASCLALAFAGTAAADEPNPYYIGAREALTYQSNVYQSQFNAIDSGISTTSLIGGIDQPFGRQHFYANGTVGYNYYINESVKQLNNTSYGVTAGLDWQTVERLAGTVRLTANQSLAAYSTADAPTITQRNIQNLEQGILTAKYGITPRFTLDAGYVYNNLAYSAPAYNYLEYSQNSLSLGLTYGQTGVLSLGLAYREDKTDYPKYLSLGPDFSAPYVADDATGKHIDFTVAWVPSGLSSLDARLSLTDIVYTVNTGSDFRGLTGALGWNYQVSGKLSTRLALLVAPGNGATFFAFSAAGPTSVENSYLSKNLRLYATYLATGKTTFNGSIGYVYNDYAQVRNSGTQYGSDQTPSLALGVSYAPTRNSLLGCNASYQKRNASQGAIATGQSYPYNSGNFSCSGQLTLQ